MSIWKFAYVTVTTKPNMEEKVEVNSRIINYPLCRIVVNDSKLIRDKSN